MAALRHGITTVIIPKDNERDLADIDPTVRRALNFVVAQHVDTVLETALNPISPEAQPPILGTIPAKIKDSTRKPGLRQ